MTIGERIKNKRLEEGLSVDELAQKIGKNRATIYRYESNEIENMPIEVMQLLSKALNCSPTYLMGWENSKNENQPTTLAAHFEGEDFTAEEEEEILNFVNFVKNKRK